MKLEDILLDLEKSAGFPPAKDEDKDDKKEDKQDKKDDDGKDDAKSEDKKDEKEEQEKSAAFKSGEQLAKEIMEKVASTQIDQTKGEEMNKQASDAGKALAAALLEKLASAGDRNTENGIPEGVVPNKTQVDLAAQKAEHDNSFQATPGTDGAGNGGTINEIFDSIVADAQARTGAVVAGQTPTAPAEGVTYAAQTPGQDVADESQEKMAAAIALVNAGVDFDEAVNLVKAAAAEIEFEEEQQVKQAAMAELIESGVDFELAAAMVKQASRLTAAKQAVGSAVGAAHAYSKAGVEAAKATGSNVAQKVKDANLGLALSGKVNSLKARGHVAAINAGEHVARNKGAYGAAAGVAAAGGAGYALGREKKAALDALIGHGLDFDTAVDLVNAKADELYGQ